MDVRWKVFAKEVPYQFHLLLVFGISEEDMINGRWVVTIITAIVWFLLWMYLSNPFEVIIYKNKRKMRGEKRMNWRD